MPAHGNFEGALASIIALDEAEREEAAKRKSSSLKRQTKEKPAKQSKKRKHGEKVPCSSTSGAALQSLWFCVRPRQAQHGICK